MSQPSETFESTPPLSLAKEIEFRPLLLPAVAFIAGIVLSEHLRGVNVLVVVLACVFAAAVPVAWFLTRSRPALVVALVLLCGTCGFLRHACDHSVIARDDVSRLVPPQGAYLRVRGMISDRPQKQFTSADQIFQHRDSTRTRFSLDVDSELASDGWQPASGTVQVNVYDNATDLNYGDRLELLSLFTYVREPSSPGQFDYRLHLERTGTRLRTSVKSRLVLEPVLAHHQGNFLIEQAHSLGARLARVLDRYHDPTEAGLLRCILLGERSAVDPETDRNFRLAGLSDLLAVSGLHVVILLGGMWLALRFLKVGERTIAWIIIVSAALYAGIASFQPPVVRAAVVMAMYATGVLVARRHDMVNSLAASALLLLLFNPHQVFFAGFQLSFIAVLGLVGFASALQQFLIPRMGFRGLDALPGAHHWFRVKANRFFISTFAISLAAWLSTQPLVAWNFQILNPTIVLLNVLLVPVFGVILFAAFLALVVETIFGGFLIAHVSGGLTSVLMAFSETGSRLPGAWVTFPAPPAWTLVVFYALLVLVAIAPSIGLRRRVPAAGLLLLMAALVALQMRPVRPATSELTIMDVGQGSAALVRSSEGNAALVDIGTFSSNDVARWTVIPCLVHSRVRVLDAVLLTHADSDHTNGLPKLVENFTVRKVLLGESFKYSIAGLRVERWLIENRVPHEFVGEGDVIRLGSVRLEVLHPERSEGLLDSLVRRKVGNRKPAKVGENERSAVVRGVTPNGTFLIFGDCAGEGFRQLAAHEDLSADVVVAPHHGGSSGGEKFAAQYRWPIVLFSAGPGFVKSTRLKDYQLPGTRTLITADTGTLTVRFGAPIAVETFRHAASESPEADSADPAEPEE